MTNINPSAGSFQLGQNFTVLANSSGQPFNLVDTPGFYPTMEPYVPAPGLQWGLTNFALFGSVSIVKSPNVWDGLASANWSTNISDTSWKISQSFGNNQGAIFDDSASGSATVSLTGNVAPERVCHYKCKQYHRRCVHQHCHHHQLSGRYARNEWSIMPC